MFLQSAPLKGEIFEDLCEMARNNNSKTENFEQTLFKAADKPRKDIDAAEYKHIAQGLIEGRGN